MSRLIYTRALPHDARTEDQHILTQRLSQLTFEPRPIRRAGHSDAAGGLHDTDDGGRMAGVGVHEIYYDDPEALPVLLP